MHFAHWDIGINIGLPHNPWEGESQQLARTGEPPHPNKWSSGGDTDARQHELYLGGQEWLANVKRWLTPINSNNKSSNFIFIFYISSWIRTPIYQQKNWRTWILLNCHLSANNIYFFVIFAWNWDCYVLWHWD